MFYYHSPDPTIYTAAPAAGFVLVVILTIILIVIIIFSWRANASRIKGIDCNNHLNIIEWH